MSVAARLRDALTTLPREMTRAEAIERLRAILSESLSLDPRKVRIEWGLERIEVDIPTRPHYLADIDAIDALVQEAAKRVNITDVEQLDDGQFMGRLRSLRGDDDDA